MKSIIQSLVDRNPFLKQKLQQGKEDQNTLQKVNDMLSKKKLTSSKKGL